MTESVPSSINPLVGDLQGADPKQRPSVVIQKVYVKDLSLEIPHAPQIYTEALQPALEMQISTQAAKLTDNYYDVSVTCTVTAKAGERTLFLVEAVQAGIFTIANIVPRDLEPVLAISCPTILYPYLRECISDVTSRAGFPSVLLGPIAFEALYLQRLQEQQGAPQQELSR